MTLSAVGFCSICLGALFARFLRVDAVGKVYTSDLLQDSEVSRKGGPAC